MRDELTLIAELCRKHDAISFADEACEYIRYTGAPHISIASLPGMADRTVTISGLSETFRIKSAGACRFHFLGRPSDL
jgi:aspartate/methionine/tyrosine aminotransferase